MEIVPIRCRIPAILRSKGKTQQWLANEIGMSKQQLSDYINMRNILGLANAKEIAEKLTVSIDDLYEWEWQ